MLIYQKTTETDKLNILFNVNESAEITTPGDIVLAKTIIGEAPNTESVVSASFASIDSTLEITGSSATTTGNNLIISGQAELTGGSNVTISATLTLPVIDDSSSNTIVCRDSTGQINLPKQVGEQGSTPGDEQAVSKEFVEEFTDSSYVALKSGTSEEYSDGVSVVYGGVTNGSTKINTLKQIPIAFMKDNLVLTPNTGDSNDNNTRSSTDSKWNTMLGKGNKLKGSGSTANANTENLVFGGKNEINDGVQDSATFGYRNEVFANQAMTHGYMNKNYGGESFVQGTENQLLGTITIDTDPDEGFDGASSDTRASAVIGNKNIIQPGLKQSLIVGNQNTVNTNCQQIITIGLKNKIGKSCSWTNTFGDSNEIKNYATDSTVFGYLNKVYGGANSSAPVQYVYMFGRNNDNRGPDSTANSNVFLIGEYLNATRAQQVVVGCCNTGDATEANAFFVVGTGTLGEPNTPKTTFLVEDGNVKVNGTLTIGSTSLTEGLLQNAVETIESSSAGQLKYTNIAGTTTTVNINGWDNKIGSLTAGSFITITGSGDSRTIAVTGLGTAATYSSSAFATSAQGTKADSAIQSITESTINGQIKFTVDGTTYTEVAVHGLGTAAYQNTSAFLAAGATAVNASSLGGQSPAYYTNVQSDWNQTDSAADDYIKNKPAIPAAQVNSDWNASSGVSQILNKPTFATVATSGNYNDLSNKPSIPSKDSDLSTNDRYVRFDTSSQKLNDTQKSNARTNIGAGTSSFSGSYDDLTNKPTIPTVSNATITIKQSGKSDQTFTLNGNAATITLNDTTYSAATTTTAGLMSADDKVKLEGITVSTGATKSITDGTNTLIFGSNAFNSTAIPTAYIQSASVNGNTLTLTDQSGSTITYTASTTDRYQAPNYNTGLKISTGNGFINSLYIPFATRANSQFCLLDEDGRRVSVAEVITHITTCFRGDTSYVTMYDGTTKLISEVKAGESVLGYDMNKQDYCEAIVLDNIKTGEANAFDCYVFEDGTTIDVYGDDSFLTHFMSRFDDMESEPTDCFSACGIKYLYTRSTEKKEHFRKIIKSTGGKDEGVAVIYKQDFYCATPTGRYCIDTSNGTCFINGLCQARKPINMLNRLVKYHKTFGQKIDSVFAGIFARYAEGADELIPDDHIEDVSSAALLKELTENSAVIEMKKSYLNSTDYKAMKYAEGVLPEEEWLPIKAKRAEARTEINSMEARNAEIIPILKEANPCLMKEYGDKYWWVKKNRKEMLDFADLNNMLEDVREYFNAQG